MEKDLTELSKTTLGSYLRKSTDVEAHASKVIPKHVKSAFKMRKNPNSNINAGSHALMKFYVKQRDKRRKGIEMAKEKMTKESLTFRQLRQQLVEFHNPTIRAPSDLDLWNKHLIISHKLSVPTQDDNLFKAANMVWKGGLRRADGSNSDEHSIGYTRPIIFGDYLKYILNMPEGYEHNELESAILEDVAEMDEDTFEALLGEEIEVEVWEDSPLTEEVLDELSKKTLGHYINMAGGNRAVNHLTKD